MKNAMRVATLFVLMSFSLSARAQFAGNWGTGQWGAQQSCPYNYSQGAGASSELDGAREATAASKKIERSLKTNRKKLERLEKDLDRARQDVEDVVQSKYADVLFTHIENQYGCEEYGRSGSSPKSRPYEAGEWAQLCSSSRGLDGRMACATHRTTGRGGRGDAGSCVKGLDTYSQKYAEKNRLAKQVDRDEADLERYNDKIQTAKDDYLDKLKEGNGNTQGGICWNCLMNPNGGGGASQGPNWGSVLVNGAVGALAIYSGYQQNRSVQKQNANMGWPSYPYDAMQAGYPFIRDALYGAIGGGTGQGGYGCAGGVGGAGYPNGPNGMAGPFGSTFGNPGGFGPNGYPIGYNGNPNGGGMFNPGMGPWGPNGYGSGPIPVNGMPGGLGYNGYPGGYQNGYGSGPIPVGGFQAGGFQAGGYQVGGYQMGGYGSGPIPVGGYGGGYPAGGYAVGIGIGIGLQAATIGLGYAGAGYGSPYGGFPYSNGAFPGSPYGYGGYSPPSYGAGYGGGYGYGYGGYGMDRSMTNYGQTSTVVNSLNQEMYNLQMRLRTVQGSTIPYGYGGISGTSGSIGGYYNGSINNGVTGTGYIGIGTAVGTTGSITPVLGPGGR